MPSQYSVIKISMFYNGGGKFPKLKGKANELRHLCGALFRCFDRHKDGGNAQDKQIKTMLSLVVRMEKTLDDHREDYTLPEAASHDFKMAARAFVRLNTSLGQFFHNNGDIIFISP